MGDGCTMTVEDEKSAGPLTCLVSNSWVCLVAEHFERVRDY